MEQKKESSETESRSNVGVHSSGTVQVVANSNQGRTTNSSSSNTGVNSAIAILKPVADKFLAAMASIKMENVSQIAGVVWDEFKEMSPWQKVLAILAAALIVGAVGYFSWKLIRGNWTQIKMVGSQLLKTITEKQEAMMDKFDGTCMIKFLTMFENRQADMGKSNEWTKLLEVVMQAGYQTLILAMVSGLKISSS